LDLVTYAYDQRITFRLPAKERARLIERARRLPKLRVVGSIPIARSNFRHNDIGAG